ncbi:hypothetical protein BRADI_3g08961v3 [Brachypodium distachyon]|uniref:Uncharacterized protein n=1 Tax=Brachypodium distachyon TaxID=15368 RepID=A0A2K2CW48_BRADI|nr:hypothetical protein BRADI_3g08961v3 [Brachypodium distachyon]
MMIHSFCPMFYLSKCTILQGCLFAGFCLTSIYIPGDIYIHSSCPMSYLSKTCMREIVCSLWPTFTSRM